MLKQTLRFRSVLALVFGLSLLSLSAFAQGYNHGNRYHYRDGRWYDHSEVAVPDIAVGAEVESLPPQYTTVVVANTPYYYDNSRYYNRASDGSYVVVAAPVRSPGIDLHVHL
jgi:hypothetical protein